MDKDSFEKYLKDRYFPEVDWYDQKSMINQKKYKILQFGLIILSSLTPVLIFIEKLEMTKEITWLFWLPAITAVLVAIFAALIKTFNYQENWLDYRTTCETLRKEKYLYDAKVGEYKGSIEPEALFVERVESLISRENTLWLATQKTDEKKKNSSS